jgi:hypothetical protein
MDTGCDRDPRRSTQRPRGMLAMVASNECLSKTAVMRTGDDVESPRRSGATAGVVDHECPDRAVVPTKPASNGPHRFPSFQGVPNLGLLSLREPPRHQRTSSFAQQLSLFSEGVDALSAMSPVTFLACWVTRAASGWAVTPVIQTRRRPSSISFALWERAGERRAEEGGQRRGRRRPTLTLDSCTPHRGEGGPGESGRESPC